MTNEPSIKELREKTGMSQSQFASHFGFSLRSLQGWEQGKRPPKGMASMVERIIELEKEKEEKEG